MALQRAGCRVGVLAPVCRSLRGLARDSTLSKEPSFEDDDGMPTLRVPILNVFPRLGRLEAWNTIRWLRKPFDDYTCRFGTPNIVHVHSLLPAGEFARWLMNVRDLPFVVTEHSTAYGRGIVPESRLRRARLISASAGRRIAVSTPLARLLSATLGPEAGPWITIPNMVSKRFFGRGDSRPLSSDRERFVFLSVGTLETRKRFDLILRALARAFQGNPRYRLRIGGAGPERAWLESLATSLGIDTCVTFLGGLSRDDVVREMNGSSAFVLGSDVETFGVVLVEALAAGLPIVATACGGPEDIVSGANGLLVPPDDVVAMADALRHVATHIDRYDHRLLSQDCAERFGEQAVMNRLKTVYEEVLAETRRPASMRRDSGMPVVDDDRDATSTEATR